MLEIENKIQLFYLNDKKTLYEVNSSEKGFQLVRKKVESIDERIKILELDNLPGYLKEEIVVVDSINSGTGREDSKNVYKKILAPIFEDLEIQHQHIVTNSANSIKELASEISPKGNSVTVIFISGDTSISEFVNALPFNERFVKINILVIPVGTGNSLALSLGFFDIFQSISAFFSSSASVKPLNLYDVRFPKGSYFLVQDERKDDVPETLKFIIVLSWAFHASLVADSDTPKLRKHGIERFKIAAYSNLESEQKYEGTATVNGSKWEGPFAYFVVTPANRFEKTFIVSPKGNILDDELYLIAFKSEKDDSGKYIMDIMGEIYNDGKHIQNEKVIYEKIPPERSITLETNNASSLRQRRFCLDGSIIALPETDNHKINIKYSGSDYNNWKLNLIS